MKISIYPSYKKNKKQGNPFINNLYDCFPNEAEVQYVYGKNQEGLFRNLFKSKIYILNWPETVIFDTLGYLQILIFLSFLYILLLRKVKFVWFFHNIEPHEGHNFYTRYIYNFMMKHSSLIVTLSKKGVDFLEDKTNAVIKYYPHPFQPIGRISMETEKYYDIYIWGGINRYKGIVEFLQYLRDHHLSTKYRILITGKCNDVEYDKMIRKLLSDTIIYHNGYVGNNELINNIDRSKYVLFPYLEGSVSSSAALMNSIEYGAQVIGPNVGAFKDASEEQVCLTFKSYNDIIKIIDNTLCVSEDNMMKYISENTWERFGENLYNDLKNI